MLRDCLTEVLLTADYNKTTMDYTYTIIIPHKNTPKLLQRCLDSIPHRDDLEIIIVDDNSDPAIVDFEKFPGKERKDVTIVFDKASKGAGHARNIGLDLAKGRWLLFADADDFFNYCIRDILDDYEKDISDVVFFNVTGIDSNTYGPSSRGTTIKEYHRIYDQDAEEGLFLLKYSCGNPIAKLISKDFVSLHSIRFDETRIHNDTTFSYHVGYHAKKIKVDHRALYCITYSLSSISYTLDDEKILQRMEILSRRDRFFLDHNIDLNKIVVNLHIESLADLRKEGNTELYNKSMKILNSYGFSEKDVEKRIKTYIKKRRNRRIINKLHHAVDKIASILSL